MTFQEMLELINKDIELVRDMKLEVLLAQKAKEVIELKFEILESNCAI